MKNLISWLLALLCALSLSTAIYIVHQHTVLKNSLAKQAQEDLKVLTQSAAGNIDRTLREIMVAADTIADELTSGKLLKDEQLLKLRLSKAFNNNTNIYGAAISFEPYVYSENQRLFSPYYKREDGKIFYKPIDYDYTNHSWYRDPLEQGHSIWSEPFFGNASNTLVTIYSTIFYRYEQKTSLKIPDGIVSIAISLDQVKNIVGSIELGPSGFGAITSRKGVYLFHPNNKYVVEQKSIRSVAHEHSDEDRLLLAKQLELDMESHGIIDHISTTTGLSSWLAFEPIPATGWSLQNTFIKNDMPFNFTVIRHQLIWIASMVMLCIFSLSLLLLHLCSLELSRKLWLTSAVASVLFIGGVSFIWHLALNYETPREGKNTTILNHATLGKLQNEYAEYSTNRHTPSPIFLPTGIFITSVRFTNDNAVLMTGYIWQKYGPSVPKDLSRAISIPAAEDVKITETYKQLENEQEVIRWQFQAKARERMSYTRYPLDREILTLPLIHKDINHNVVLVPDIPAYKLMNKTSLPGLEKGAAIPGWTIEKTFFDLAEKGYNADFGITHSVLQESFPLLRYNIVVRRNFLDAFISNLTPLIVVAMMLFLLLLTTTSDSKTQEKMKTGTGHTLSMSSALFFVVIFSHIGIRQRIQVQDIFYLEYFYFVIYAAILGVAIASILFAMAKNLIFIQYRDNLASKVAYWPSILSLLFAITVYVFY